MENDKKVRYILIPYDISALELVMMDETPGLTRLATGHDNDEWDVCCSLDEEIFDAAMSKLKEDLFDPREISQQEAEEFLLSAQKKS